MDNQPIAISFASSSPSVLHLPEPLRQLLTLRSQAESALEHPALDQEMKSGQLGQQARAVISALEAVVTKAQQSASLGAGHPASTAAAVGAVTANTKMSTEDEARIRFIHAWALCRVGEYDGTPTEHLPSQLERSLELFQQAGDLLQLPKPPPLDNVPSVTRPREGNSQALSLPEVQIWVGEMLAEWARTQATLAFSTLLAHGIKDQQAFAESGRLAELLDIACRRNVQALFTPLSSLSAETGSPSTTTSTVLGNAQLLRELATLLPHSTSPEHWTRRLELATHVADVRFVEASLSANALVDEAQQAASVLSDPRGISTQQREGVRRVLERTVRKLVPFERTQGACLLGLGRVMLEAVGALYLAQNEALVAARRRRENALSALGGGPMNEDREGNATGHGKRTVHETEADDDVLRPTVPENDLVRETRQVLIRAAALFENAYASFLRTPASSRSKRDERRLLRRLETTYITLEELDNDEPEVVQLKTERIERALWINDRLLALGDQDAEEEDSDGDGEYERGSMDEEDEDSEDDDEGSQLARRLARSRLV